MKFHVKLATLVSPFHTDDLFDPTDEVERREIEGLFVERNFRFDETVFQQGSAPADVWRIVKGTVVLSRCNSNCEPVFARIVRHGEILGLTETLAQVPLEATLRTVSSCVCEQMDRHGLAKLIQRRPRIRQRILAVLAENYGDALARAANVRQFV